jgi:DNA invertase Pin-like site-specific DNA recombinase
MTCAVYIRKSREEAGKASQRLTVQREQLPVHARAQGWHVEIYDDGHASAARGKAEDLRERARLEADVRAGRIQIILCIELSRLSRDETLEDYLAWLNLCAQHKVKLATPSRVLDPSQTSDWMLLLMEGGFSSVEMKILQARMAEGRQQAFISGKWLGGTPPPPYVYDKVQGRPVIDPQQLEQMLQVWQLAETQSARAIASAIGMPEIAVRRAIADDRLLLYQALRRDPATGETVPCDWEPVMDADQAARVRAGRRHRKTVTTRREAAGLLSALNLMYCGFCGRTVKTWTNSRQRKDGSRLDYYACHSRSSRTDCPQSRMIPQPDLERRVIKNLFFTMRNSDDLKHFWALHQDNNNLAQQLRSLDDQEASEKKKKDRLIEAVAEGLLTASDVKTKAKEIEAALEETQIRRQDLKKQLTAAQSPDWDSLTLRQEDFDLLDFQERRTFVQSAIRKIFVFSGHAIIDYRFPRDSAGSTSARINLAPPVRPHHKRLPKKFTAQPSDK